MALEAQNNPFTSVLMVEAADPEALPDADPSAGSQRLAVGADHLLYLVNSAGTKTLVGAAAASDATLSTSDITTNNATTSKHGFLKKLDNNAAHYMDGTGAWSTPAGGGGGGSALSMVYLATITR